MDTETPNKPASKPPESFDRFHPEMPQIPGVSNAHDPAPPSGDGQKGKQAAQIAGLAAVALLVVIAILWRVKSARHPGASDGADVPGASAASPAAAKPAPPTPIKEGPIVIATAEELAKPWSAKKFVFMKPFTRETVDAIAIRLPGKKLWGFALQEPFGHCTLELVTDLHKLANQYGYRASHPMVVNPCNNTIYDPLQVGPLGNGVWVRGQIVQGADLRPPMSIDMVEKGQSIIADRME
jgi:hypothetical protein